jgi:uncharacterized integral membrane protein
MCEALCLSPTPAQLYMSEALCLSPAPVHIYTSEALCLSSAPVHIYTSEALCLSSAPAHVYTSEANIKSQVMHIVNDLTSFFFNSCNRQMTQCKKKSTSSHGGQKLMWS